MESKELSYILIIIILVLVLLCNNNEPFLNLLSDHKKKIKKCCKGKCDGKPSFLTKDDCEENKKKSINTLKNQNDSKFKNLDDFYEKRPKFEINHGELEKLPERIDKLKKAIEIKEYVPAMEYSNNYGNPGFYVK